MCPERTITRQYHKEHWRCVVSWEGRAQQGLFVPGSLCVPLSLQGLANICLPNICSSLLMNCLPLFEVPYPCLWASLVTRLVKNLPQCRRRWFNSWHQFNSIHLSPGRSPGERNGYPLQHSCLENSLVPGVAKSWTQLSN